MDGRISFAVSIDDGQDSILVASPSVIVSHTTADICKTLPSLLRGSGAAGQRKYFTHTGDSTLTGARRLCDLKIVK